VNLDRQEVAGRLHSAALHLVRTVRAADVEMGLTPARASVLSVLVFGGPRTVGELARTEGTRSPTMSGIVSGLVDDRLARRARNPDDARSVLVEATPKARRLLEKGRERRVEVLSRLLASLGPGEIAILDHAARLIDQAVAGRFGPAAGNARVGANPKVPGRNGRRSL
jgi:DNA-binding MarR family transcriptional regulator